MAFATNEALSIAKLETTTEQGDLATRLTALEAKVDSLTRSGTVSAASATTASDGTNLLNYMYKDSMIFQDVFNAMDSNVIRKIGNPAGWDQTSYAQNPWNGRRILRVGGGVNSNGNGIVVAIPPGGYDVLWVRVLNDRWTTFRASPHQATSQANFQANFGQSVTEVYAGGLRNLNEIAPDGGSTDGMWNVHKWMPIPVRDGATEYQLYTDQNSDGWISGIAFGKNLWNHATNAAVAYLWKLNPQTGDMGWIQSWNNDNIIYFPAGSTVEVSVPVVPSGKDKLLYLAEHNNNWTGTQHGNVYVNGVQVERFRTSFNNPFAIHFNSKLYMRYMATRIPASMIQPGDRFLRLKIEMINSNQNLHVREMGTHDAF